MRDTDWVPGSWLWCGPGLIFTDIWGVNQRIKDTPFFSPSFSSKNSIFKKIKINRSLSDNHHFLVPEHLCFKNPLPITNDHALLIFFIPSPPVTTNPFLLWLCLFWTVHINQPYTMCPFVPVLLSAAYSGFISWGWAFGSREHLYLTLDCVGLSSRSTFSSRCTPRHTLGGGRWWFRGGGPGQARVRPRLSFSLLSLAWPSVCRHLGTETLGGKSLCLCFSN